MINTLKKYIYNITFYHIFFSLFLTSLVSGPLIPEIMIFFLIIFFLKNNQLKLSDITFKKIFYFLILFYLYININSVLFSFDYQISLKSTLPYFRFLLLSYIICHLLLNDKTQNLIKIIIYSYLILLIFLLIDSCIQILTGNNLFGFGYRHGRVTSFFGSEQILGSFVIRTLPISIALIFSLQKINKKLIFLILTISIILILLSAERTSLAYLILFLLFFIFLETKKIKNFIIFGIIINIIILSSVSIYPPLKDRIIKNTINQIQSSSFIFIPSYRHELHYSNALNIFKDNLLFGTGIKSFRYICKNYDETVVKKIIKDKSVYAPYDGYMVYPTDGISRRIIFLNQNYKLYGLKKDINYEKYFIDKYFRSNFLKTNKKLKYQDNLINLVAGKELINLSTKFNKNDLLKKGEFLFANFEYSSGCNTHPHNIFLQFLAELGALGGIFFLIPFCFLVFNILRIIYLKLKSIKLSKIDKGQYLISVSLLLSLFPLFPSGNFFNNWLSMIFFFKLGILLFYLKKNKYTNDKIN